MSWRKRDKELSEISEQCRGQNRTQQLVKAATSIPANIAEGYGGARGKGYRNYLTIARRSTNEADYWLYLSQDVGFISTALYSEFSRKCTEIILMLTGIISKL